VKIVSKARQARLNYASRIGRTVPISEVAEATGINRMALTKIEQGTTTRIDFDILAKLCAFYGVAIADLLEYDPNEIGAFDLVAA
jgi:DNA-binding Xre family transcriptional regulator